MCVCFFKGIELTKIRNQSLFSLQAHKCYIVYFIYQDSAGQGYYCQNMQQQQTEIRLGTR